MCCCESKPQKRQLIRLRGYFSCAPGAKSPSKYAEPRAPPPWPRTPRAARRRAGPRPPCRLGSWLQRRFWKRTPRLSLPLAPRRGLARWRDCHLGFRPPRPGTARGSAVGEAGGPGGGRQAACNVCLCTRTCVLESTPEKACRGGAVSPCLRPVPWRSPPSPSHPMSRVPGAVPASRGWPGPLPPRERDSPDAPRADRPCLHGERVPAPKRKPNGRPARAGGRA